MIRDGLPRVRGALATERRDRAFGDQEPADPFQALATAKLQFGGPGAKVRERVPDWVVRKADQIELIDSSPEQLRRRMVHGNIYPKERVAIGAVELWHEQSQPGRPASAR
jgi:Osmosensitive K+ channel His kinase sensor domain